MIPNIKLKLLDGFKSRGRPLRAKLHSDIFQGELPTPKNLEERFIRVRVRDGAQELLVPVIDLSSLKSSSYFCALLELL